ncbi:hypothetical protein CEB3_c11350 [Peptococcaceae bacterium CEB3]|nr:hypothetical protein CEB3_c11350 [Peptococcaceae bacterium CEB3]
MDQPSTTSKPATREISLAEIFLTFFKMGLTAFGPAMMVPVTFSFYFVDAVHDRFFCLQRH